MLSLIICSIQATTVSSFALPCILTTVFLGPKKVAPPWELKSKALKSASVILFVKEALSEGIKEEFQTCVLPDMRDEFMVMPASIALQLLAYYVSCDKGFDVDKPRNLAKVVTVE